MTTFLLEIGTEEIPHWMIPGATNMTAPGRAWWRGLQPAATASAGFPQTLPITAPWREPGASEPA